MTREAAKVEVLFNRLVRAERVIFPQPGEKLKAPSEHGVYVIYNPDKKAVHVGRSIRGKFGLRQRLVNHLMDASSFTNKFLKHDGSKLRRGFTFSCLVIDDDRIRALVEALAIDRLCPKHLGTGRADEPPLSS